MASQHAWAAYFMGERSGGQINRNYSLVIRRLYSRSATPLKWRTETTFAVAVGHRYGVVQALTLDHMYQGKGLRADGF